MICNKIGVQIVQAMMKDVVLVPDCAFNLFSISKHLKQGWRLGGTNYALVLTSPNGNNQIKFNIKFQCQMECCIQCASSEDKKK